MTDAVQAASASPAAPAAPGGQALRIIARNGFPFLVVGII